MFTRRRKRRQIGLQVDTYKTKLYHHAKNEQLDTVKIANIFREKRCRTKCVGVVINISGDHPGIVNSYDYLHTPLMP